MKKRMKKLLSVGLTLVMLLSMAGCQSQKTGVENSESSSTATESSSAIVESPSEEVDVYDTTKFPESVSVFHILRAAKIKEGADDYNQMASYRMMEEMTGTHIDWTLEKEFGQKFQLMLASEKYPDVMVGNWNRFGGIEQAIEDGVIINLNDYREYMPNFLEYTRNNPDVAKGYLSAEGEIRSFPFIRAEKELCIFYGPLMRTDWLKALNLEVPTDPESLYEVLVAFKTKDPNGNGKADEIPMSGVGAANLTRLLPMFGTSAGFYLEDGKVQYGPLTEEFDEGMAYIAKLYDEGLIDEEYLMIDRSKLIGKITNHQVGFAFEYQPSAISRTMAEDPNFEFLGIPHFKNAEGVKVTSDSDYVSRLTGSAVTISTQCENPESVVKWVDSFYSEAGYEYMNFGEEGVTFNKVNGEYEYTDQMVNDSERTVSQMLDMEIASINGDFAVLQAWDAYSATLAEEGKSSIETWADVDTSMALPSLSFTAEENEIKTAIMAQVETLVNEKIDKIIMGQDSVEVMDELRKQIIKLGIEDVIAIYQAAYDRYDSITLAE